MLKRSTQYTCDWTVDGASTGSFNAKLDPARMFHLYTNRTDTELLPGLVRAPQAILGYNGEQRRLYTERDRTHRASRAK
jgi:hypothetical protein